MKAMNAPDPPNQLMPPGDETAAESSPALMLLTRPSGLPRALDVEIPRLRLVRLLDGRWDQPVTLLVAGPGFGKTTFSPRRCGLTRSRRAGLTCG